MGLQCSCGRYPCVCGEVKAAKKIIKTFRKPKTYEAKRKPLKAKTMVRETILRNAVLELNGVVRGLEDDSILISDARTYLLTVVDNLKEIE